MGGRHGGHPWPQGALPEHRVEPSVPDDARVWLRVRFEHCSSSVKSSNLAVHARLQDPSQVHRKQEVPFPILPWCVGTSTQSDCNGGVQLRHGGLLPPLLLRGGADRDVHGELPSKLQHKPSTSWVIFSHTLVQAGQEQESIPEVP